jgi:hypothetical protein
MVLTKLIPHSKPNNLQILNAKMRWVLAQCANVSYCELLLAGSIINFTDFSWSTLVKHNQINYIAH